MSGGSGKQSRKKTDSSVYSLLLNNDVPYSVIFINVHVQILFLFANGMKQEEIL